MENNLVTISGLVTKREYSHERHGEKFYKLTLNVFRQSGIVDKIPVLASEKNFSIIHDLSSEYIEVTGEFRSYNQEIDGKRRLVLSVLAKTISLSAPYIYDNRITLDGFICKQPNLRTTPLGRTICDLLIAVNRKTRKSDYIPCVAWGKIADTANELKVGDNVILNGRIQSRQYTKNDEVKTVYEVSIDNISVKPEEIEL